MTVLAHLHIEAENGPLSNECVDRGIISFQSFIEWVEQLPYGRNSDRADYTLIFEEERGACSTKNALVKAVATENDWNQVQLFLGIYAMSEKTNPGVGKVLNQFGLTTIPEAHVYLKIDGEIRDVTGLETGTEPFYKSLQTEIKIQPEQIGVFKMEWHQKALQNVTADLGFSLAELWTVRQACIAALSV